MDTTDRHYHIASITPEGVILYESEFDSAEVSVDNFIGLAENIYANQNLSFDREVLLEVTKREEGGAVTLGYPQSQFRLIWLTCDRLCDESSKPERN